MQYRSLGKSNLQVSALCLGTMMFGDQTDPAEAGAIMAAAHEHGVNTSTRQTCTAKGGGDPGGRAEFWLPTGIFIDDNNLIYIADSYNQRVQVFRYIGRPT